VFNHYQQHESRIVAHFSLRKFPLGSALEGKSEHESEPKPSNRTNTGARRGLSVMNKNISRARSSEFIEVSSEAVGKKLSGSEPADQFYFTSLTE
jgi:hypothetical protein